MVTKNIIYLFLILCPLKFYAQCNVQELKSLIKNDSVKFKILNRGVSNVNDFKLTPSTVIIEVTYPRITLSGHCDSGVIIRSLVSMLNNKKSDWCAILLLYSMSGEDATKFMGINKSQWRSYYKKDDIENWKNYLIKSIK